MAVMVKQYPGFITLLFSLLLVSSYCRACEDCVSAIGDPGMRRDGLRVAIEAWNQCNEVHEEAPNMGSPRQADCFDVLLFRRQKRAMLFHKVGEEHNKLGLARAREHGYTKISVDEYAAWKEGFLGFKCQVLDKPRPWQFWMVMLKSETWTAAICPKDGKKSDPFAQIPKFPCFGKGCMNMPLIYHNYTSLYDHGRILRGPFYGTWDLDVDVNQAIHLNDTSYHSVLWEKELGKGSWVFYHILKTSTKYSWLMLYFRSDSTRGFSGGYHYEARGMSKIVCISS